MSTEVLWNPSLWSKEYAFSIHWAVYVSSPPRMISGVSMSTWAGWLGHYFGSRAHSPSLSFLSMLQSWNDHVLLVHYPQHFPSLAHMHTQLANIKTQASSGSVSKPFHFHYFFSFELLREFLLPYQCHAESLYATGFDLKLFKVKAAAFAKQSHPRSPENMTG